MWNKPKFESLTQNVGVYIRSLWSCKFMRKWSISGLWMYCSYIFSEFITSLNDSFTNQTNCFWIYDIHSLICSYYDTFAFFIICFVCLKATFSPLQQSYIVISWKKAASTFFKISSFGLNRRKKLTRFATTWGWINDDIYRFWVNYYNMIYD